MTIGRIIDSLWRGRHAFATASKNTKSEHIATYGEAVIYFTFTFGSTPLAPNVLAQRLLVAGIAETVSSPVDAEVRMAPRYRQLARVINDAEQVAEVSRAFADARALTWARKHPLLAARLATSALGQKLKPGTRGPTDSEEADEENERDLAADMDSVVAAINERVAHRQALNAIQRAREHDMYQPAYLEAEPYLRLTLRAVNFGLSGFSGEDEVAEGQRCDVLLLIHRSGVLQLTLAVRMPEGITSTDLIPRTIAAGVRLSWTEVAEPIMEAASRGTGARSSEWPGKWSSEMLEGTRWRKFLHPDPVSLVDLFRLYHDAISHLSDVDFGDDWLCYPVVCIDHLGCCHSETTWIREHRDELAGILLRYEAYGQLRGSAKKRLPKDRSISTDHSVWHSSASTTVVSWTRQPKRFDDHLWTVLLAENFLLQLWQLRALDQSIQSASTDPTAKTARALQRRLIFGLEEFHRSSLTYGDAQETVAQLLQESGADRTHALMIDRLEQLGAIDAAERAERSATRALAAAVGAFAAVVIFGLPAIDQTLTLVKEIPKDGVVGFMTSPLRGVANLGLVGSYACYIALLAVLLTSLISYSLPKRSPRHQRIRHAGYPWPGGTITVVRRNRDEDQVERATGQKAGRTSRTDGESIGA
jgi:hypothetical protein